MVPSYGHYLHETSHRPGEHHFICVYLIPRLNRLGFLPDIPKWVSPDGTKGQCGDVVFEGENRGDVRRLSIEVKISYVPNKLEFTVSQYNLLISNTRSKLADYRGEPDLLLAAIPKGIAVVKWDEFQREYLKRAFPNKKVSPDALPFDLQLMNEVKSVNDIQNEGRDRVVVATVDQVLHFRIFDSEGKMVVDRHENEEGLSEEVRHMKKLKKNLAKLWHLPKLTETQTRQVVNSVISIVDYSRKIINAPSFRHGGFKWCRESFVSFPPEEPQEWAKAEQKVMELIDQACRRVWDRSSTA